MRAIKCGWACRSILQRLPAHELHSDHLLCDLDLTRNDRRSRGSPEQLTEEGEGRIMVFYHVHAMNNWRDILLDQCTKMIYSGLYEAATAVYSGVSGPSQKVQPQQCCLPQHALA